ncbi:unnamed protein product [Lasius platythorax]|uniref:Myb-like domain-containing protein n=1 Tax=Lasius platythorax TaxID=488582 RepID=A0AAV2N0C6_9HYME
MSFESKIGLSQHERHAHPRVKNTKRAAEAEQPAEKCGRKLTVWSAEELERFDQLSTKYSGEKNINIKLMEFFPGKTNKQISDAGRRLKPQATPASQVEEDPTHTQVHNTEANITAVEPPAQEAILKQGPFSEFENWRDVLISEIEIVYDI